MSAVEGLARAGSKPTGLTHNAIRVERGPAPAASWPACGRCRHGPRRVSEFRAAVARDVGQLGAAFPRHLGHLAAAFARGLGDSAARSRATSAISAPRSRATWANSRPRSAPTCRPWPTFSASALSASAPPVAAPTGSAAVTASDTLCAARRPRQPSDGLPSVSTAAMISPPIRLMSVRNARRSSALRCGSDLAPEAYVRQGCPAPR